MLISSVGDETDNNYPIIRNDKKWYASMKGKFESHFVKRKNVIFDRTKFYMRKQEENEPFCLYHRSLCSCRTLFVWSLT